MIIDTDWKTEVFKRLDVLSEKLGVAAGHLWQVLVKQSIAEGIASLLIAIFCTFVLVISIKVMRWVWLNAPKDPAYDHDWKPRFLFAHTVAGIAALASTITGLCSLYTGVLQLVNPEYGALKIILEIFGK
jgi:hypothetical protein